MNNIIKYFRKELWVKESIVLTSNQNPPSQAGIQETSELARRQGVTRRRKLVWFCLLWFRPLVLEVCVVLVSSFPALSFVVNLKISRDSFSHLRLLPAVRPGCPVPLAVEVHIRGTASLTHSMSKQQRMQLPES